VIAFDTNLLVYAHRSESPFHAKANQVFTEVVRSGAAIGVPWPCCHEFISTVTHPRLWKEPLTGVEAIACIEHLGSVPRLQFLGEGRDHLARLRQLGEAAHLQGGQIHDARIAAICLSHGVKELLSCDRDFSRFPSLRVRNPLI
jgi:toxin-antitoxin system PIN domain toxin